MTKVLIIDVHAETYHDRLHAEFPQLEFVLAPKAAEAPGNLSDIDVLICFGIAIDDSILKRATQPEMDPVAGDRRRSFPALPVAAARSADHQRARHPWRADARGDRSI